MKFVMMFHLEGVDSALDACIAEFAACYCRVDDEHAACSITPVLLFITHRCATAMNANVLHSSVLQCHTSSLVSQDEIWSVHS